jgi:NADH:ubiquinone oxidoreductase subunit 6 (subunit J)
MDMGSRAAALGRAFLTRTRTLHLFWGAYALLLVLAAVPVFSTVLPPLFDYPNHLARMHVLAAGGDSFYSVRWEPLPNLAQDLIVPPLARLVPLELASKLFLVAIFGLIAGATVWLNRVATGRWRVWSLLAFLFLYNRTFLWGFLNYLFGIGVALAGTALWLALERRRRWARLFASSLVALACWFSHIAAFGFYTLVIIGVEIPLGWTELRARRWRALAHRIALTGVQFMVPAVLILGYWDPMPAGAGHLAIWRKADLLFSVFDNYNRPFDIACILLVLALVAALAATGRLRLAPRLGWAAGLVFSAYLVLPSQIYGGSGADHRLPVAMFLLLIAGSAAEFRDRRIAVAFGAAMAGLLVARLAVIEYVWLQADQVYSTDLAGIDMLPQGARLAVAYPASAVNFAPIPEVHLPLLAVVRRSAFVPTLFVYAGQQPVGLRPAYAALTNAASPTYLWAALKRGDAAGRAVRRDLLQHYDFVAMVGNRPPDVAPTQCLEPFFARPNLELLKINHDPPCGI